jgi:hypothetical protein
VHAWKVSISSHHYEQATLANVNRIGIVRMSRADELVSFVAPRWFAQSAGTGFRRCFLPDVGTRH